MKKRQKEHIERVRSKFMKRAYEKYVKGAREHGSDLLDMEAFKIAKEIQDEAIDLFIYSETLLEKLAEGKER